MSNSEKNKYERMANLKALLAKDRKAAKGKGGATLLETGKDFVIGGIAGAAAGAIVGKHSLWIGLLMSGAGNYFGQPIVSTMGIGMMASGGYQVGDSAVNGIGTKKEMGDRLKAYGNNLKQRLFLDKIMKSKEPAKTTVNGLDNVQYFKYPHSPDKELDMGALDQIEQEIANSSLAFERANPSLNLNGNDWQTEDKIY